MRAGAVAAVILAPSAFGAVGCSYVLGVDADRYVADSADAGDAAPGAADWSCLDQPRGNVDPAQNVAATVTVIDYVEPSTTLHDPDGGPGFFTIAGEWLPGVAVQVCSLRDARCTQTTTQPMLTDDAGAARFALPGDFDGYFDIQRSDLVSATLYPGRLVPGDTIADFTAYELRPADLPYLLGDPPPIPVLGADANVGVVFVEVFDCQDNQAPGVAMSYSNMGSHTTPFYFINGLPFLASAATATDSYGQAGAVNVPVGSTMITATRSSDQKTVGTVSVDIRAGGLVVALIRARAH
jgi:hypothetical protein